MNLVILKLEGSMMCKTDEIGEICISSISCGSGYFGLSGKSEQYFKVCCASIRQWVVILIKRSCLNT